MRLLVTGGSGYLGSELLRRAAGRDDAVGTRLTAGGGGPRLDVRDASAVRRLIARVGADCVIHTAYVQSGPAMREVVVDGSRAVAAAAAEAGARLIHLSTDVVFGGERPGPWREADQPCPITGYGRAKADAERLVVDACPGALVVRTSLLYGGVTRAPHEQLVADAVAGCSDARFFTDELRCPIAVTDLAAALLELAGRPERGVMHLAGPEAISRYEFARLLAAAGGGDPDRVRPSRSADLPVARPRNCALDSSRAHRLLRARVRGPIEVLG
ncbi:MAG: SDR family oxidoreductase [Gaiellales bacterium]